LGERAGVPGCLIIMGLQLVERGRQVIRRQSVLIGLIMDAINVTMNLVTTSHLIGSERDGDCYDKTDKFEIIRLKA